MAGKRLKIDGLHCPEVDLKIFPPAQWRPCCARVLAFLLCGILCSMPAGTVYALSPEDAATIPHVGKKAQENYTLYQYAGKNKAFAIAPGGAWAWQADETSEEKAANSALENCQANTQQKCLLYALNDSVVFDVQKWPTLWGPYADASFASQASVGTGIGERFPDLVWFDASRRPVTPSQLHGKIVFIHFWASWCPPCLREFPSLEVLQAEFSGRLSGDVEMVLLQMREPFSRARQWVDKYGFSNLPLYDSGATNGYTSTLSLSSGDVIKDRELARVFPSTYVLDRNGLVIFSHHGPVMDWLEYLPFFEHAVAETVAGKRGPPPQSGRRGADSKVRRVTYPNAVP